MLPEKHHFNSLYLHHNSASSSATTSSGPSDHSLSRYSLIMETITTSKSSFNGELQQFKLNITEQHIPISHNSAHKQYINETTVSSPYLKKSQTIPVCQINHHYHPADDKEIRIFDAQKYFDEGSEQFCNHTIKLSPTGLNEHLAEFPRYSPVSNSVYSQSERNYQPRSIPATPVASSEASWNSQTGFLYNFPSTIEVSHGYMNPTVDEKRKINNPRWFLGRICPCGGEKSIQVNDKTFVSQARSPINYRSIYSMNHSNQTGVIPKRTLPAKNITATPGTRRLSQEKGLFDANQSPVRSSLTAKRSIIDKAGFSFPILPPLSRSKTATISRIHNRIAEERSKNPMSAPQRSGNEITDSKKKTPKLIEDDASSDSSSDLFEIESFSTQQTYQPYEKSHNYIHRGSLDEAADFQNPRRLTVITSTMNNNSQNSLEDPPTPTKGYVPREASVDWSVTTAEGFDKASVATVEMGDDGGRSRVNGLLGLGGGPSLIDFGPSFNDVRSAAFW